MTVSCQFNMALQVAEEEEEEDGPRYGKYLRK
jgi:hypothetical protein